MKADAICPHCEVILPVVYKEDKNTIVCARCYRPYELYPDGRVEISALYECVGRNWHYDPGVFYDPGPPDFVTRERDKND